MCGIIGIIGKRPVAAELIEGLRRLEYRGYDSAGVATLIDGRIERRRAQGKLANLAARLERDPVHGTIGIGHTRWATHGLPTEDNAHPIATDRVAVLGDRSIRGVGTMEELTQSEDPLIRVYFYGPRGQSAWQRARDRGASGRE